MAKEKDNKMQWPFAQTQNTAFSDMFAFFKFMQEYTDEITKKSKEGTKPVSKKKKIYGEQWTPTTITMFWVGISPFVGPLVQWAYINAGLIKAALP